MCYYLNWSFAAVDHSILPIKRPSLLLWLCSLAVTENNSVLIGYYALTGLYSQYCSHFWCLSSCTEPFHL